MGFFYAVPLQATPATKNYQAATHQLPADHIYMVNFKLHLYFSGWGGGVIIKLKVNLS